jgi:hypothetical protein
MEKPTMPRLYVLLKEGLHLININPKQGRKEGAPLFHLNGALNKLRNPMCSMEASKNGLIKVHDGCDKDV